MIIDFHIHIFPNRIEPLEGWIERLVDPEKLMEWRRRGRSLLRPLADTVHRIQPMTRHIPGLMRDALDEAGSLALLPHLLVESLVADAVDAIESSEVDQAVVIAHPPYASNEWILDEARKEPRFIPAVMIPPGSKSPGKLLAGYAEKGARILKIHAASDGEGPLSKRYRTLLEAASRLEMPVIIHTGCPHTHLLYRAPELGDARQYTHWFEKYPDTPFILAHMNFHEPDVAIELMREHPNVYVDTSWQPTEVIGRAVLEAGSDRILFGSDWPLGGNNIEISLTRIRECVESGAISEEDAAKILGGNAQRLLGLE